jgi:Flp pilus assembly pilin Flp
MQASGRAIRNFVQDQSGTIGVEHGVIAFIIGLALIPVVATTSSATGGLFEYVQALL